MKDVTLNNGVVMPSVGFGVYQIPSRQTKNCVLDALKVGYRHIDTARNYGNEQEVGQAIKASGLKREEIFLTTKIYGAYSYLEACQYIDDALKKLQVDYLDLLLFHWPSGNLIETYRAMEDYYKQGKIKALGLSNFFGSDFKSIINNCRIMPAVNQVEAHVFHQRKAMLQEMKQYGICLEAWSPLACGKHNIFNQPVLKTIATTHQKSIAQIALKFLNQKGIVVIPKSTHLNRIKENVDIFDFKLTDEEIKAIEKLDLNRSLFGWYE